MLDYVAGDINSKYHFVVRYLAGIDQFDDFEEFKCQLIASLSTEKGHGSGCYVPAENLYAE